MIRVEWPPGPRDTEGGPQPGPAAGEESSNSTTTTANPSSAPPRQHSGDTVAGQRYVSGSVTAPYRRPGCVCRAAPKRCYWCEISPHTADGQETIDWQARLLPDGRVECPYHGAVVVCCHSAGVDTRRAPTVSNEERTRGFRALLDAAQEVSE